MFAWLANGLASLSLLLKQPLTAYCDLETADGDALITKSGHYLSWIRVDGMQRMAERKDFGQITEAMRSICRAHSRRAGTPSSAGIFPIPMPLSSRSSASI